MTKKFADMSWFEQQKRMRNNKDGYPEDKGLKDGHCNRSGCLQPLAGQKQHFMRDHEFFTDAKLFYCNNCAHLFTRADNQFRMPIRCTLEPTDG
jgi:hypothetical protein